MTMTLAQVAWKLGELARDGAVRYDAHDMAVMCSQMADAITAHLSQPQPVAQGEAVALQTHKWERKYTGTGRTVWECSECFRYGGFAERPCSEPSKHPGCNADALQATPTIPTGHRVVPVEPTEAMIEASAIKWTQLCRGYAPESGHDHFMRGLWKAMLAAAPDVGGV